MTTIYQPFVSYEGDGATTRFVFNFPYLSRSDVMVTRDEAPALFKFVDDHTLDIHTLFGEPLPDGEKIKIFRQTPDLDAFAEFKDASLMTAADLNRARLQVLYLIQERSGGIAGSVSSVVSTITNEIETLSGALDSLSYSQGLLTAGLQTIGALTSGLSDVQDAQAAVQQLINDTIAGFDATTGTLTTRLDQVESKQNNLQAAVSSQIATLVGNDMAMSSRIDSVVAELDGPGLEDLTHAAIITSAIAEANSHVAQAKDILTVKAQINDATALIQVERDARVNADGALAQQITALQTQIGENIAQVIEDMQTSIDTVDGKVTGLSAQYTLKAAVQRADGKPVMASIGLAATDNDDMSGSEIVMMANRLVFADSSAPNGALKPMFVAGNVDGSPTFVIPANVMGDKTYPGRLLVDGAVEARAIAADAVTADKIKAGSVTVEKLDVTGGTNRAWNSEFIEQANNLPRQWNIGGNTLGWCAYAMNLSSWTVAAGNTHYIRQSATDGVTDIASKSAYMLSDPIPVTGGERYEYSAYVGVHRCSADINLYLYASDGTFITSAPLVAGQTDAQAAESFQGGVLLTGYKRIGGFILPPAGAATARLILRKSSHATGQTDSYLFWTKPFVAPCNPNQTRFSPYNVSGLGTYITPAGISTPSISALSANFGTFVTGNPAGLRTVITGSQTLVYDENNRLRVRMGVW
ncbi:phage tail fiber protein [Variovorax sp. J22G73]|uniref:phage tail fiber domain-containing protein n=1 Tax=unclassified Variovorax TaxID=663243 RepID=UPI00257573E6|nr:MULTISPECIES: phage tail fiber protein [unclassified Variovorax]MDM0006446.1 phage tail fiber protein [Variovorax sp. J22R203]MDM0097531.1 phage tail fiber protein [Variovorax sp. J22G73]